MKRATITLRPQEQEPYECKGWATDVDGVPVVLCRRDGRYWECFEPRTGLNVSGRSAETREEILRTTRDAVRQIAADHDKEPADWFEDLIDQFQRRDEVKNR